MWTPPSSSDPSRVTFTTSGAFSVSRPWAAGGRRSRSSLSMAVVAIMKMISSTIMMSANGVTLISADTPLLRGPTLMLMAGLVSGGGSGR
jgi:hypothetical protein